MLIFFLMTSIVCSVQSSEVMNNFSFETVCKMASELSHYDYTEESSVLPESLLQLDYDKYRKINYKHSKAIWNSQKLPFNLEFFHRGYIYKDSVDVYLIENGKVVPVKFSPGLFEYQNGMDADLNDTLGFAGVKIIHRLGKQNNYGEAAAFLGASYFRAVPLNGIYGASARGIAVNTAVPDKKEEYPSFRKFWILRPLPDAKVLIMYALLDGPSVTGAYWFEIEPGEQTYITVHVNIFIRKPVEALGLAPLTSMYMYGEDKRPAVRQMDEHPEVHDSDGLLVEMDSNEWIWRPLQNPVQPFFSSFGSNGRLKGFGVLQRDRNAENYNDIGGMPEKRTSMWVEPIRQWPQGKVELLELSTNNDWEDNIVAQYVLDKNIQAEAELKFEYRIRFYIDEKPLHQLAQVIRTFRKTTSEGNHLFEIDFRGKQLQQSSPMKPDINVSDGKVTDINLLKVDNDVYRLSFNVSAAEKSKNIEIRASLINGEKNISEIWSDQWKP